MYVEPVKYEACETPITYHLGKEVQFGLIAHDRENITVIWVHFYFLGQISLLFEKKHDFHRFTLKSACSHHHRQMTCLHL